MSIAIAFLAILSTPYQGRSNTGGLAFKPAATVGQREIVLGPLLQKSTVMQVQFNADVAAEFGSQNVLPSETIEFSKGYVYWSVTDGKLNDKPCRIIKTEGMTKGALPTKTQRINYVSKNTTTWWVQPDGKLLQETVEIIDPTGTRQAEVVYASGEVDVSLTVNDRKQSYSLFPNIDMSLLDSQFKPMIEAGKIVLPIKEFVKFDPFSQSFTHYKAMVSGTFHLTFMATKFEGMHVDIEGPKDNQIAYVSKDNDLVRVDLPSHLFLVLDTLPRDKDPFYKSFGDTIRIKGD